MTVIIVKRRYRKLTSQRKVTSHQHVRTYTTEMPQGKTKVKAKVPDLKAAKQKKSHKGVAFTRRHSE